MIQPSFSKVTLNEKSVRETVEALCKAEFDGDNDKLRRDLVVIKVDGKTVKGKHDRDFRGVTYLWDWYEMDVVTSYSIGKIEIGKKEAKVTISYDKIAEQKGEGIIKPVTPTKIDSVMTVINTPIGLRVVNPPVIKVSRKAVENWYIYQYHHFQKSPIDEETRTSELQRCKNNLAAIGSSVPKVEPTAK
mgnify:FL=1